MNSNALRANESAQVLEMDQQESSRQTTPTRRGLFALFAELRRRQVCRALTAYCVALWVICQIVEVVSPQFGLPEWTLNMVIVLGLLGLPIAIVASWMFEVTPHGLVLDSHSTNAQASAGAPKPRTRFDQLIDCGLMLVALVIGAQLALASVYSGKPATPTPLELVTVTPFPVSSESNAQSFSGALQAELQHELARLDSIRVVVPRDSSRLLTGATIAGSVTLLEEDIQVTAMVIDNPSGEVTWSKVMTFGAKETGGTPRNIAKGIVNALEGWSATLALAEQKDGRIGT